MAESTIGADYLIMGGGASAMAFADSLLTESNATMVIVDRHHRPGGHWNDAYPFVRLHQPSSSYGVNSAPLGFGAIDEVGLNIGFEELASGQEVLSHYDRVMRQRFLPSGRVRWFPTSDLVDDEVITSRLSREQIRVEARRFVDATHSKMLVPSTTTPEYAISTEVTCIPLNDLPRAAHDYEEYVVIGAGKTGMDACIWLLDNGADPTRIRWIMPRDSWVLNRANFQPSDAGFARMCQSIADQVEAVAMADSVDDVFARARSLGRTHAHRSDGHTVGLPLCDPERRGDDRTPADPRRRPTRPGHLDRGRPHGARAGLHPDRSTCAPRRLLRCRDPDVALQDGVRGQPHHIAVDPHVPAHLQRRARSVSWRHGSTTSTSRTGSVRRSFHRPCRANWLRMLRVELANRACWMHHPEIGDWMAASRLDPFTARARARLGIDTEATRHIGRYLSNIEPAVAKLEELLAEPVAT